MAMVCSQCNRAFEQRLHCPECGERLVFHSSHNHSSQEAADLGSPWQQTPWGRMAVGLILAQGLGYGLQQLLTAGFLMSGERTSIWNTLVGTILLHGIQGICLLIGGALCGAGKQRGFLYGSLVGLVNGLIFLMVQGYNGDGLTQFALYGQPFLHTAFGALGGLLGTLIWKPMASLKILETVSEAKSPLSIPTPTFSFLTGPINIVRVCLGVFVVVNGFVWSNAILNWVLNASQGTLEIRTHFQAQLIGWEVCALTTLFGAGLAGSNSLNGVKHGLWVGLGSSVILTGVTLGNPRVMTETIFFMIIGIPILTIAGGWFGSQLFPPIRNVKRRNRILTG